jgi:hypothetical protein
MKICSIISVNLQQTIIQKISGGSSVSRAGSLCHAGYQTGIAIGG